MRELRQSPEQPESAAATAAAAAAPWVTIVWDDPVNLMNYVTYVFQKLFGYSEPHATKLMLEVHNDGKAVVSSGSRESMEGDASKRTRPGCGPPCSKIVETEGVRVLRRESGSGSTPPAVLVSGPGWTLTRQLC